MHMTIRRKLMVLPFLAVLGLVAGCMELSKPATDLTIEVEGDLLRYGGVVTVYDIPVPQSEWPANLTQSPVATVKLNARYNEIQLRRPAEGKILYRFRTAGMEAGAKDRLLTHVLTVIGGSSDGSGPGLQHGFVGANPSGGQIIRVLPLAEYAAVSEAERIAAQWGQTEGYDALPPADTGGARALVGVIEHGRRKPDMTCSGDTLVQACRVAAHEWNAMTMLWWRALAESRLERFRDRALKRCYDDNLAKGGGDHCKPDPTSHEPAYLWQP
jgi:hypothetical protein